MEKWDQSQIAYSLIAHVPSKGNIIDMIKFKEKTELSDFGKLSKTCNFFDRHNLSYLIIEFEDFKSKFRQS